MKKLTAAALLLGLAAGPAQAVEGFSLTADPYWAVEAGTHLYDDADDSLSVAKSLELGVTRGVRALFTNAGVLTLELGLSQTAVEADVKPSNSTGDLTGQKLGQTRLFGQVGFETHGRYFFKPILGVEHTRTKVTRYTLGTVGDEEGGTMIGSTGTDNNVYVGVGFGYRFASGGKGIISINTLGDNDDGDDIRVTYSASIGY